MQDTKLSETARFMSDFWQLIKKFYTPDLNPGSPYWNELISASSALGAKYEDDRLAEKLILGFLDYEEKVRKEGQEKGRETLGNPDRGGIGSTGKG